MFDPNEERNIEEFSKENLVIPFANWVTVFVIFCLLAVVFFA